MARQFTLDEARRLLPRLRELMATAQARHRELAKVQEQLAAALQVVRGNGHSAAEVQQAQAGAVRALRRLNHAVEPIHDLGCEVKDVEMGLLDFRSLRDGREVYLCWKVGEETIAFWHELDTGFAGRQPLDAE